MSNFPTFTADPAIDMMEMGITHDMYVKLQRVAAENHCVIMIRKTNKGSVLPFANRTAVGKKLATKGKSSDAFFTKGNITFLAQMSKKLADKDWFKEQNTLIKTLGEKTKDQRNQKYKFIPKVLTENQVRDLLANHSEKLASALAGQEFQVSDNFGGKRLNATYKLVRTDWASVNSGDLQNLIVEPAQSEEDTTTLYRVYVKSIMSSCGFPLVRDFSDAFALTIPQDHTLTTKPGENVAFGVSITWNNIKDSVEKLWPSETNEAWNNLLGADLSQCAPKLANEQNFREVRVLALFTKGKTGDEEKGTSAKKYYEVVADYDIFMIAPEIDKLEFRRSEDETIESVFMTIAGTAYSVLPVLGNSNSIKPGDRTENPYGLLSPYDFYIRKEINRALGIKVAQHGAEVVNLFYTSDIKDPVIAIYPGAAPAAVDSLPRIDRTRRMNAFLNPSAASGAVDRPLTFFSFNPSDRQVNIVSGGPGFLMSIEMLFEMMAGHTVNERIVTESELNGTYAPNSVRHYVDGKNFSHSYGLIFNLNWGTDAYYNSIMAGYQVATSEEQQALKSNYENEINTLLNAFAQFEEAVPYRFIDNYFGAELSFSTSQLPLSLKAFLVFLFIRFRQLTNASDILSIIYSNIRIRLHVIRRLKTTSAQPPEITQPSSTNNDNPAVETQPVTPAEEVQHRKEEVRRKRLQGGKAAINFLKAYYSAIQTILAPDTTPAHQEIKETFSKAILAISRVEDKIKKLEEAELEAALEAAREEAIRSSRAQTARPTSRKPSRLPPISATKQSPTN